MRRIRYKKIRKAQPNYYEYTGIHRSDPTSMQLFVYNEHGYEEYDNVQPARIKHEISDESQKGDVKWLNIHGLHDTALIKNVTDLLEIEPFIVSDILNVSRRTRIDELDNVFFFSIKSVLQETNGEGIRVEQISFVLQEEIIVSFQEKKSDFFSHIRERIRSGGGIVRKKKNDYLLYLLLDAVMENFFITIDHYENTLEELLVEAKNSHKAAVLERIEKQRENFGFLKRAIVPLRDALFTLKSIRDDEEFNVISENNYTFFARLHQKSLEILEQIEYDLNTVDSASSLFYSSQTQRMNQIMKTLTIFSVIFMPLTFIVGVYGMNFHNIPELRMEDGYYYVWGVMIVIVLIMVYYFKRKNWF